MATDNESTNIILIHGLFMPGVAMIKLRNYFKDQGYTTTVFSYHTISETPEKNSKNLLNL